MSVEEEALDYFGRGLIEEVRDLAMSSVLSTVRGEDKSVPGRIYSRRLSSLPDDARVLMEDLCRDAVDSAIHYFLWWLEREQLNEVQHVKVDVTIGGKTVENIAEKSDGLAGEYEGKEGWMGRFSKYPVRE